MSESRHHLRSVSDLYAADEIEVLLLEEIRDLEPPPSAYSRPEDIQDFEIAGSRTGGQISSQSSDLDSPGIHSTVHSWDSHANYRGNYGRGHRHGSSNGGWPRTSHLVFYCDIQGHLKTTTGVIRLLLLISSTACLITLCSSGTAKVSLFMLPLVGRLRFMIFVAVFCILLTAVLLFLDITHVINIFPFNWGRLNAYMFSGVGVSYIVSSTLLIFAVLEYHGGGWVPRRTRSQLTATAGLGLSCALMSFLLSWLASRSSAKFKSQSSHDNASSQLYKPVDTSSSGVTLKEKSPKRPTSWVVKKEKKRKADSDSNTENGNQDKYKPRAKRKDHWATTRHHFIDDYDDMPDTRKTQTENEKRQRRRRKEGQSSMGSLTTSKTGTSLSFDESGKTGRKVPRKLPLQNLERPRKPSNAKQPASQRTNDEDYWASETQRTEPAGNGDLSSWEAKPTTSQERRESLEITVTQSNTWSTQFRTPPDDVQPCSSKTLDPYPFA